MTSAICDLKHTTFTYIKPSSQLHKHTVCLYVTIGKLTRISTPEGAPEVERTSSDHLNVNFLTFQELIHCGSSGNKHVTSTKQNTNFLHLFDKFNSIQLNSKFYLNVFALWIALFKNIIWWMRLHHFFRTHVNVQRRCLPLWIKKTSAKYINVSVTWDHKNCMHAC